MGKHYNVKTIEGFSDYRITSNGVVYSYRTGKIKQIKGHYNNEGYHIVSLIGDDGKSHCLRVHRLVAEAFCERPIGYNVVHHLNQIPWDNRAENLLWVNPILHEKIHHDKL